MTDILKTIAGLPVANTQDIQNAAADKASYYFDGNTDKITMGSIITGNQPHTLISTFSSNGITSASQYIFTNGTYSGNSVLLMYISDTGLLIMGVENGSGSPNAYQMTSFKLPITACSSYDGAIQKGYVNGISIGQKNYSSANLGSTGLMIGNAVDINNVALNGSIYRTLLFNYALDENKIKKYSAGAKLDYEDVGGSMTDLSSGLVWDNINFTTFTPTGSSKNITSAIGSYPQYARLGFINPNGQIPIVAGKKYRMYYSLTSTGEELPSVAFLTGADAVLASAHTVLPVATNGYVDITATVSGNACMRIFPQSGSVNFSLTFNSLVQLGAVLDLEPEGILSQTIEGTPTHLWLDSSPNGLHGTVTGALPINQRNELIKKTVTTNFTASQTAANIGSSFTLPVGTYLCIGKGAFDSINATTTVNAGAYVYLSGTGVTALSYAFSQVNQVSGGLDAVDIPLSFLVISTGQALQAKTTFTLTGSSFSVDAYFVGEFIKIA